MMGQIWLINYVGVIGWRNIVQMVGKSLKKRFLAGGLRSKKLLRVSTTSLSCHALACPGVLALPYSFRVSSREYIMQEV